VELAEMVALIRGGVSGSGGIWADLGAGTGNFTWALRELLGRGGAIYAVDRDGKAIRQQRERLERSGPGAAIHPLQGDITRPLDLPALDGALMANVLHFIRDQPAVLDRVRSYLRPGGRLLVVEYDLRLPMPWVPVPVSADRFRSLASAAGLATPALVGTRRSPSSGITMYAGVATRAAEELRE
jgi:ubiquinone/menaquinone biosynthesis C-methylase UbiE